MTLAADGDTWGIPGSTFLVLFLCGLAGIAVLSVIHRRVLFAGHPGTEATRLGAQQAAYLTGGDKRAVFASLGGLRASGAIGSGARRAITQTGPLPAGVTPLDTAVYNAAGRRTRIQDLTRDPWVASALTQLREGLETAGFAVTPAQRRTARMWALAAALMAVAGMARVVDGMQNDKPVFYLVLLLPVTVALAVITLVRASVTQTRAARRSLNELRSRHAYLMPSLSPSYPTYGADGAAMGVALWGTSSLYAMDPAFAAEAGIERTAASGGAAGGTSCGAGATSSSSSCSSGGGGGCGGGGGGGCGG